MAGPRRLNVQALVLAVTLAAANALAAAPPKSITVGTLTLKLCDQDFNGYCGSIKQLLDPTGSVKGNINIAFVYYPRFDQTRLPSVRSCLRKGVPAIQRGARRAPISTSMARCASAATS